MTLREREQPENKSSLPGVLAKLSSSVQIKPSSQARGCANLSYYLRKPCKWVELNYKMTAIDVDNRYCVSRANSANIRPQFEYRYMSRMLTGFAIKWVSHLHIKQCMWHEQRVVEINQHYITWAVANHALCGWFHWLTLRGIYWRDMAVEVKARLM